MGLVDAPAVEADRPWGWLKKVGFRFAFVYLTLFSLPFLFGSLPYLNSVAAQMRQANDWLARWTAKSVLGIERDLGTPNGSGDRLLNYVEFLDLFAVAAIAAAVWTLVDWRQTRYRYLSDVLRALVRWGLALQLLSYGWAKVFAPRQFPEPDIGRLMQPYGESSPMGLLWTFMGASQPYTIFGGVMEVLPGFLLLWRRTALAGALLAIAVMGNIVAMNFCYDVPVKLYSLHYLAMAFWIALWDGRRLANFFLLNRPAPVADLRMPLPPMRRGFELTIRIAVTVVKVALVLAVVGLPIYGRWQMNQQRSASPGESTFDGGYVVERFERNGEELPPLLGDGRRWRSVAFYGSRFGSARTMDSNRVRFNLTVDDAAGSLTLKPAGAAGEGEPWTFARPDAGQLELSGKLDGQPVKMRLKRADRDGYLLVNRGFHWVNESPFNR